MKTIWRVWQIGILAFFVGACNSGSTEREPILSSPKVSEPAPPRMTFSFSSEGLPTRGNYKCDPVLADLNGDGLLDLAAHSRLGDGPQVWLGDRGGRWHEAVTGLGLGDSSCGGGLCFGDVNQDGHLDLVLADHCQGLFVFLGDGAGRRWELVTQALYPHGIVPENADAADFVGAEDVALGDINGDGRLDLVAGSSDSGGIAMYFGDGTGRNWTLQSSDLPTSGLANRVQLTDINGDGRLDLVASYNAGPRVWWGDGKGGWQAASEGLPSPRFRGLFHGLDVGDVDEDGRLDIAVANWIDGPEVYLQQADGSWRKTPDVFPEMLGGACGLTMGDIDQDGHLDMVVSGRLTRAVGYVYGVFVLCGDGRGGWTYVRESKLPKVGLPFTWGIVLGDIDGDGVLDVVTGSGGIVATNPDYAEPVIPAGVLVWLTELPQR